ncbi:MAG: hypothetical protein KGL39_00915 [Patescibacteria group bacterium]|nr:hypothetical protein [Patescibacteria group bacterium]
MDLEVDLFGGIVMLWKLSTLLLGLILTQSSYAQSRYREVPYPQEDCVYAELDVAWNANFSDLVAITCQVYRNPVMGGDWDNVFTLWLDSFLKSNGIEIVMDSVDNTQPGSETTLVSSPAPQGTNLQIKVWLPGQGIYNLVVPVAGQATLEADGGYANGLGMVDGGLDILYCDVAFTNGYPSLIGNQGLLTLEVWLEGTGWVVLSNFNEIDPQYSGLREFYGEIYQTYLLNGVYYLRWHLNFPNNANAPDVYQEFNITR